ncbi:MAG: hypothetical protein ACRDTZ_01200 [Pseudonocardiaceae bacterium]
MTTTPLTPTQRDDAAVQSASALCAAITGDWARAARDVGALADQYQGQGVQILLLGLADTLIARLGEPAPDQLIAIAWMDPVVGGVTFNAEDVPRPEIRWAGRFIAARAAKDHSQCVALVNACHDETEYAHNVFAVLEVVAMTLRAIKGGAL